MKVFLFFMALQIQGLVWALLARRTVGIGFCVWAGFPLGLLLWALASLLTLLTPLPYDAPTLLGLFGCGIVAGSTLAIRDIFRSGDFRAEHYRELALSTLAFVFFAALFARVNLSIFTPDSLIMLDTGRAIAFYGAIEQGHILSSRGVLIPLIQGASILLDVAYLPGVHPLLAVCMLILFAQLGARGLMMSSADTSARSKSSWPARGIAWLAAVAMVSPYFMLIHFFYLHANLAAGAYLFLFSACFFMAERQSNVGWLPFSFAFLLAFSLSRVEAPAIALLVISIAWSRTSINDRTLIGWLSAFCAPLCLWQTIVWWMSGPASIVLGPFMAAVLAGLVAAFVPLLALASQPPFARIRNALPVLLIAGLCGALGLALAMQPLSVHMSLLALLSNIFDLAWGGLWPAITLLGLGTVLLRSVPSSRLFIASAAAYILLIVLMGVVRIIPYQPTWQDSGNRMLIHVVPLLMFWLTLAYGRSFISIPTPSPTPVKPAS